MTKKSFKIILSAGIILTAVFIFMPERKENPEPVAVVPAVTTAERINYFALHGWEAEEIFSRDIIIPSEFSESYEDFAEIQDKQKLPLRECKGMDAVLYTYRIKNYAPDNKNLLAELIVCDGKAVSSAIYAEDDSDYIISVH